MENPTISELRSRSRSKTPFLRSSCDRENCTEGEEHSHVSGRKTPIKRSTPIKQIHNVNKIEAVQETIEESPHTYRTRQSTRQMEKLIKTSDYSSEESPDRLKGNRKEIYQNEINSQYERVSTSSQRYATLADVTLSPILTSHNVTQDSKYPKTDYTYSPLSRDRVELAPGQVAVPNMSRRSLSQFRIQGPNTVDEPDIPSGWKTSTMARRYTAIDSSDDEGAYMHKPAVDQRWWLTRLVETIITTITTTAATTYRKVVGPSHRYPYTERRPAKAGVVSRLAAAIVAPVYWIFSTIKTIVTTTVTTVTENISPDKRDENKRYSSRYNEINRRRWWPWLALLLLPVMGYGYYNYKDVLMYKENVPVDAYKPPEISQDSNINERVAALESWALKVDNRLNYFDKKISVVDNLEARVEEYSVKHLQRNLIRILSDDVNSDAVAEKLKRHFDRNYVSNEQISLISQEIHERLLNSWQTEMNEDKIRQIVQDYLYDVEKKQMEIIVTKIREYVGEVESRGVMRSSQMDLEEVKNMVMGMLQVYDADRTGKVDYALESAGGQILSTKCTELYQIKTKQYSILGIPVWWVHTSPRHALTPGAMPAECWAFQGFPGYLVIRTYALIEVTGFTLEHMSRLLAVEGKIESAPKNFSVYGLHNEMDAEPHLFGDYMYDANGTSIQHFPVKYPKTTNIGGVQYPVAYDIIELRIESNHGNPTYTCVYRFRVHGNPLTDIRKADNI
ncbi:klaroid protein-like isoform X2 [Danaus plexippus]|uniref:klaroid protein-like isoform X2 n=1 Tax=Danaus plexippus TaxID=13037 RepID=UPI002AB145AC|nr:klaroid protein-like isoform X2 [Danaus plexippus]